MKAKIISAALITTLLFSLEACQPTPETEYVVKKDAERLIEQSSDAVMPEQKLLLSEQYEIPDSYQTSLSHLDGNLSIQIDADVQVPKVTSIPVVRVRATEFTQEQVSRIFDTLCGNTEMWNVRTGTQYTKSELEEIMLNLERMAVSAGAQSEAEQISASIVRFKELYQSAPETIADTRCFGELSESIHVDMNTGEILSRSYGVNAESRTNPITTFLVTSMINEVDAPSLSRQVSALASNYVRVAYRNNRTALLLDSQSELCLNQKTQLPETIRQRLSLSPDEAIQKVNGLLVDCGMDRDFAVSSIYLMSDKPHDSLEHVDTSAAAFGYRVICVRQIAGIECISINNAAKPDDAAPAWYYEYVEICLDDEGVFSFQWVSPLQITDMASDSSVMLPFSEIMEVFENMIFIKYAPSVNDANYELGGYTSREFLIDRITLSLQRIIEPDATYQGLLIPVWNFYGAETSGYKTGDTEQTWNSRTAASFISINAIDGSIINIDKGY